MVPVAALVLLLVWLAHADVIRVSKRKKSCLSQKDEAQMIFSILKDDIRRFMQLKKSSSQSRLTLEEKMAL